MAQELALCRDGDEGMVSGLSACDRHRRCRLRTGMAHVAHSAFFKVAHYRPGCHPGRSEGFISSRAINSILAAAISPVRFPSRTSRKRDRTTSSCRELKTAGMPIRRKLLAGLHLKYEIRE